jgi:protein translocase SecG subunit
MMLGMVTTLLAVLFIVNCVAIIVFVLFRQSDSGGVGAAFGGGGDGGGAFGAKGQAMVDKVLVFMGAMFIVLALIFNLHSTHDHVTNIEGIDQVRTQDGGE